MNLYIPEQYLATFVSLVNTVFVPLLIAIAFLYFLWGVYRYFILGASNDSDREKGKKFILWGIIAFAAIVSLWGLVNMVGNTFGFFSVGNNALQAPLL